MPQRFLEHDAAIRSNEIVVPQAHGDRTEQARRGREIGNTNAVFGAGE